MPMLNLPTPTRSELERIETDLRMEALETRKIPKTVREAKGEEAIRNAWRSEALRFWYLVKQRERANRETPSLIIKP